MRGEQKKNNLLKCFYSIKLLILLQDDKNFIFCTKVASTIAQDRTKQFRGREQIFSRNHLQNEIQLQVVTWPTEEFSSLEQFRSIWAILMQLCGKYENFIGPNKKCEQFYWQKHSLKRSFLFFFSSVFVFFRNPIFFFCIDS